MIGGMLVCSKCQAEFSHPICSVYEYKDVSKFDTSLPDLKIGYCLNCKKFVCIQKGIKYKDIVTRFFTAKPGVKDSYTNLMYLMQGKDSVDCCTECCGTSLIEGQQFMCPICKEGVMEHIPYQGDTRFRLGKKYIFPKLIESRSDGVSDIKKIIESDPTITNIDKANIKGDNLNIYLSFLKKTFFFIISWVYSSFIAFILALGFGYLTVWFMQFSWMAAIIYFILATMVYSLLHNAVLFTFIPLYYFVGRCKISKWVSVFPLLYYGYVTITLPWKLPFDYSFVNYFMAFELSSLAFASYYTMVVAVLSITKESDK